MENIKHRLIIDTDIGIDDAIAMMIALTDPKVDVLAITTVSGNVSVEQATTNTCLLLDHLNMDVPVFKGANSPIFGDRLPLGDFMGNDGLGNTTSKLPPSSRHVPSKHAALELIDLAKGTSKSEPFTLVALGPLTNLALAVRLDPAFVQNVPRLVIMGGAVNAMGNASASAEFNILADPEAAAIIFEAGFPDIWIIPWETAMKHIVLWEDVDKLKALDTSNSHLFFQITEHLSEIFRYNFRIPGMPLADPLAMAVALQPQISTAADHAHVSIETVGNFGRGLMAVDMLGITQKEPNAHIVTEVDYKSFWKMLYSSLKYRL
jgi:purine nucleosidase